MTHEPIRVIHFSPHVTWQGTQAELDAMLAEGWPVGSASEIIAACKRDAAEAEAYAEELEAKLAKAINVTEMMADRYLLYCGGRDMIHAGHTDRKIMEIVLSTIAELKGDKP